MRTFPGARLAPRFCLILALCASQLFAAALAGQPAAHMGELPRHATFEELRARLSEADRLAALAALTMALDQAGDGAIFAWTRTNSALKGIIKPTAAFRNTQGQVCRHVIYGLTLGDYRKQIEVVACRMPGGGWRL